MFTISRISTTLHCWCEKRRELVQKIRKQTQSKASNVLITMVISRNNKVIITDWTRFD